MEMNTNTDIMTQEEAEQIFVCAWHLDWLQCKEMIMTVLINCKNSSIQRDAVFLGKLADQMDHAEFLAKIGEQRSKINGLVQLIYDGASA